VAGGCCFGGRPGPREGGCAARKRSWAAATAHAREQYTLRGSAAVKLAPHLAHVRAVKAAKSAAWIMAARPERVAGSRPEAIQADTVSRCTPSTWAAWAIVYACCMPVNLPFPFGKGKPKTRSFV
jgi:hypothetical protein